MFVYVDDGGYVNLAHVMSYKMTAFREEGFNIYTFTMTDGSRISGKASGHSLEMASCKVIPAGPGYYALYGGCGTDSLDSFWHLKEPIVAWRVGPDSDEVYPVTLFGSESTTILDPDGAVTVMGDCRYDDIGEWIESRKEELIRERERRKQPATA